MDSSFPLPVFNIESEEEDDHQLHEVPDIKNPKCDHLHRLLSDRSLSLPTHNQNAILKKLEGVAEDNLLKKNLKETVSLFQLATLCDILFTALFCFFFSVVPCPEIQDQLF